MRLWGGSNFLNTITMITPDDIEEASFAAWPCFEEEHLQGWRLRFANGFTKRANSVNAGLDAKSLSLEDLDAIALNYRQRGLPSVFRLCSHRDHSKLDDVLEGQAYRLVDRSMVMTCPLNQGLVQTRPSGQPIIKASLPPKDWLAHYYSVSGKATGHSTSHLQLLELMPASTHFAVLSQDDQSLSCGIGVLTEKSLGLFEIATRPSHKRQGLASTLCHDLLSWGYSMGASNAYLQVEEANLGAIRIYEAMGFQRLYSYWYRVQGLLT
jgi:N-acetylglutamate synthase